MYRPKVGTPKAKQLKKLKQEKDFKTVTKFTKRNIEKCHKTAVR